MSFYNPKYYNELRRQEARLAKEKTIKYYDNLAQAHLKGEISGQEFPEDGRWMNTQDRLEMIKRNVIKA